MLVTFNSSGCRLEQPIIRVQNIAFDCYGYLRHNEHFFHMAMSIETIRNLGRTTLIMIGAVAAVGVTMLYIVLSHHGPAVCTNASFCG